MDPARRGRPRTDDVPAQRTCVEQRIERAGDEVRPILGEITALGPASDLAARARFRLEDDRFDPAPQELVSGGQARDSSADHRHPHDELLTRGGLYAIRWPGNGMLSPPTTGPTGTNGGANVGMGPFPSTSITCWDGSHM